MSSMFENLQKKRFFPSMPEKDELPISQDKHKEAHMIGLRRRPSSFSINVQPLASASTAWAFRRSQLMPSFGEFFKGPLRKQWDWGQGWILSRKLAFAKDIEMNEESAMLRYNTKESLMHLLYKLRSDQFWSLLRSETLQALRYNSTVMTPSVIHNFYHIAEEEMTDYVYVHIPATAPFGSKSLFHMAVYVPMNHQSTEHFLVKIQAELQIMLCVRRCRADCGNSSNIGCAVSQTPSNSING